MSLTIYTQPGCGPCFGLERLLQSRGLLYTKIDVSTDAEAAELLRSGGFASTPVVYDPIRDEYCQGVDPDWLPPAQPLDAAS